MVDKISVSPEDALAARTYALYPLPFYFVYVMLCYFMLFAIFKTLFV